MRKLSLIVAALLASTAAHAQVYGEGCRGETLSGLARCIEANTPPPPEEEMPEEAIEELSPETEGVVPGTGPGTFRAQTVSPVVLGGSLQPTNLRVQPPIANLQASQAGAPRATTRSARRPSVSVRNNLGRSNRGLSGRYDFDPLAGTGLRLR